MKRIFLIIVSVVVFFGALDVIQAHLTHRIYDLQNNKEIPMIGLNVPRDITRQVSRKGFNSLSEEQKGKLANVSCRVDKEY